MVGIIPDMEEARAPGRRRSAHREPHGPAPRRDRGPGSYARRRDPRPDREGDGRPGPGAGRGADRAVAARGTPQPRRRGARRRDPADSAERLREPTDGAAWRRVMGEHRAERVDRVTGRLAAAPSPAGIEVRPGAARAADRPRPGDRRDRSLRSGQGRARVHRGATRTCCTGSRRARRWRSPPMQSIAEARLRESIEVAERERARWARELHDETLQGLGALRVRLAASLRQGRPERVDAAVREAVAQIEDEIANLQVPDHRAAPGRARRARAGRGDREPRREPRGGDRARGEPRPRPRARGRRGPQPARS